MMQLIGVMSSWVTLLKSSSLYFSASSMCVNFYLSVLSDTKTITAGSFYIRVGVILICKFFSEPSSSFV